jgi:hypothetical protein
MANDKQLEERLVIGRRYLVDDIQRPIELRYEGEVKAFVFKYVDWYSSQFSDPYLRIRRGNDAALKKFRPLEGAPENPAEAVVGDLYHVPSGLGGVFTVEFAGLQPAHCFQGEGCGFIVLSEARARKVAESPVEA